VRFRRGRDDARPQDEDRTGSGPAEDHVARLNRILGSAEPRASGDSSNPGDDRPSPEIPHPDGEGRVA
jgi:hypothetical protein